MEVNVPYVEAVFFDLDDTLYDRESAVENTAIGLHATFGRLVPAVARDTFVSRILTLDNHGYGDKSQLFTTVVSEWRLGSGIAEAMLQQFWESIYHNCRLSEDTRTTLQTLRSRGKRLGIITNGSTTSQNRKLESLHISELFDVVLISEAEGLKKPDPAIFLRACARCGTVPSESIYVGDNPEVDIAGASAAGLMAVLKSTRYRNGAASACTVIDQLSEVLPLCIA